tara:strand:- start:1664 stop:2719 length:1056 start_codon:yes stop_codon:yes gene_type:complete
MRAVLLAVLLMVSCSSGCLEVPLESCEDTGCFPFNNDLLNELLSNSDSLDVLLLASENSKLRVKSSTTYQTETQLGEIHWNVAKDDEQNLRSIAMRFSLGTTSIDTEVIEGTETTNIRLGNVWYEGRDAVPDYKDPFYEIAQQAVEDPDGFWPSFGFDTTSISELEWTITHDVQSLEQVASAQNETHSIILVLKGMPPELIGVELYGNDDSAFVLSIVKGDDVQLNLQPDLPRAAIEFDVDESVLLSDDTTIWAGYVPLGFTSEVDAAELSFEVIESGSTIVEFNLADLTSNQTDVHGDWWDFIYWDYSGDGYFSASDYYEIRTNSTNSVSIKTYDSWADTWAGEITHSND